MYLLIWIWQIYFLGCVSDAPDNFPRKGEVVKLSFKFRASSEI